LPRLDETSIGNHIHKFLAKQGGSCRSESRGGAARGAHQGKVFVRVDHTCDARVME